MGVSVNPPKTPVTAGSNGVATATIPNVCKMPGPPAPFVPAPLPNIGKSSDSPKDYSNKVTIEGKKVAIKGATFKSTGDVASKGTGGGLVSANTHGPTKFVGPGSMDVKIEGKSLGFEAPIPTGRHCSVYHRADAGMVTRASLDGEPKFHVFRLGASDQGRVRRILGEIAAETSLEIEIDEWAPPL